MAQLNGVQTVGDSVIIYEGKPYELTQEPARVSDIVRSECRDMLHFPFGAFYAVWDDGCPVITDNDGDDYSGVSNDDDFTVFRAVTLTTAQLIEQKRAELAELEAKLAIESRPKVGDYARTLVLSHNDHIPKGAVVKVAEVDGSSIPFRVTAFITGKTDWVRELEFISPAEAKAALIAQVETLFPTEVVA